MQEFEKYGEIKEFRSTPKTLVIKIGNGFSNDGKNVTEILQEINSITSFRKVKKLVVRKDDFKLILNK